MARAVEKRFDSDGAAVNVGLGFVPDFAILIEGANQTNPDIYIYSKQLYDTESIYGLKLQGSDGVVTRMTTEATGLKPLNTVAEFVLIPAADGNGYDKASVSDWANGTSYASGARTTTAVGTVVRPPTHNGRVFELTTASGSGTSAPSSWDVAPGVSVTDGGSNVWICREERIVKDGAQGLTIGVTTQTDGHHQVLVGFQFEDSKNAGDAASVGTTGVV